MGVSAPVIQKWRSCRLLTPSVRRIVALSASTETPGGALSRRMLLVSRNRIQVRGSTHMRSVTKYAISPAVWIVVDFTWTPRTETAPLGGVVIRSTQGETWDLLRGRNVGACGNSVPGVPKQCTAAIEVPVDRAAGARLEVTPVFLESRYDSLASIDLGITPEQARTWAASTDPVDVPLPKVGPR